MIFGNKTTFMPKKLLFIKETSFQTTLITQTTLYHFSMVLFFLYNVAVLVKNESMFLKS